MTWLSSNWIWLLLLAFAAFHLFGHRRHRYSHHGYGGGDRGQQPLRFDEGKETIATPPSKDTHDHAGTAAATTPSVDRDAQQADDRHPRRRHGC